MTRQKRNPLLLGSLLELVDDLAHDACLLHLGHGGLEAVEVVLAGLGGLLRELLAPCGGLELGEGVCSVACMQGRWA
jgi:hypothetical protein